MPFIFPSPHFVSWPCLTKKIRTNSTATALSQVFGKKLSRLVSTRAQGRTLFRFQFWIDCWNVVLRRSDFYQQTKFIMSALRSKSFTNKYLNTYRQCSSFPASAILNCYAENRCTLVPRLPFPVPAFSNIPFILKTVHVFHIVSLKFT